MLEKYLIPLHKVFLLLAHVLLAFNLNSPSLNPFSSFRRCACTTPRNCRTAWPFSVAKTTLWREWLAQALTSFSPVVIPHCSLFYCWSLAPIWSHNLDCWRHTTILAVWKSPERASFSTRVGRPVRVHGARRLRCDPKWSFWAHQTAAGSATFSGSCLASYLHRPACISFWQFLRFLGYLS